MLRGMIGLLKGKVEDKGTDSVLIDVQGVGYEVLVPLSTLAGLPKTGEPVTLYIHTHVREDEFRLFGFESQNDKLAFQTMLKVSGVGPKLALAVLGALSGSELARVIGESDAKRLSSIPGIGKKTAERMILELGGKLKADAGKGLGATAGMFSELASALQNLGFKGGQVDRVVAEIRAKGLQEAPFEVVLREALGMLKER
jgi:Holliday junction DNA helicase RuvA